MGYNTALDLSTELDLDPKIREEYIKKLEDLVSFPDLYQDDFETWMSLIEEAPSKWLESEEMTITKQEYNRFLKQYKRINLLLYYYYNCLPYFHQNQYQIN